MSTETYENTDSEITYGSSNKKALKKSADKQYYIRQKLDSINEQRSLDRQLNSFSHYWDM
jgi:hypothetical protein